jgi:hypothetical protein
MRAEDIGAAVGRSKEAVYCRAKYIGLHKENPANFRKGTKNGRPFAPGNVPWNAGTARKSTTPLRDKIVAIFAERQEATLADLSKATGSTTAACWKVCSALRASGNIHVARYQRSARTAINHEAVYRIGLGVDAERPGFVEPQPVLDDPYEIQPIPAPKLGPWGCVWTVAKQTAEESAER